MKKKILIISSTPTHPPFAGNRHAILSYANLLKKLNNEVVFLFVDVSRNKLDFEETKKYWQENFYYFRPDDLYQKKRYIFDILFQKFRKSYNVDNWYPNKFSSFIKNIDRDKNFDIVIVNYIWFSKVFKVVKNMKKLIFTHDVFSNRYEKTGSNWFSVSPRQEKKALDRADVILAIQKEETEYFKSITNRKVITTYSPIEITETKICNNKNLLFFSGPNESNLVGIIRFIEEILPSLKKQFSDLNLMLGGRICSRKEIKKYEGEITLYGEFNDPKDFYSLGDIAINPVYLGTGLKIKIIEALSYQKIMISHPHNLEGIFNESNIPIYKATTINDYVKILTLLFNSPEEVVKNRNKIEQYIKEYQKIVTDGFCEAIN